MSLTLSLYIARRFLSIALGAFLAVLLLVVVVDLVELMRSNSDGQADFLQLIGMALLHAPQVTITAAPFTVLLASMTCFALLARRSELVVTRAAGVSVWRLLMPGITVALAIGIFVFAVWNPLAAAFAQRFEALEQRFFDRSSSALSVAGGGIWLRQGDSRGQTVIRAQRASATVERLWDVQVFRFDGEDKLETRIDARTAVLEPGHWRLNATHSWDLAAMRDVDAPNPRGIPRDELRIATDLTRERIEESFADPRTIPFWKLPGFIQDLEQSGFSSVRHRLHLNALMAQPMVFVAMLLIGAAFSMRHARFGGLGAMALGCVLSGFAYFFLADISAALGATGAVPVLLAAWGPPASAVLFALGLLLHLEDG